MSSSRRTLPIVVSALTLLAGCDDARPSFQGGSARVEGPIQVEGPVEVNGGVDVLNPVRVEGPVSVTGTLQGIQDPIRLEGPVETTGRIQGIDQAVSVQGTVGLSGPVEVKPGAEPLRVVTADTDASRIVSKMYGGGWGSSFRAIEKGPLILTSAALVAFEGFALTASDNSRLFHVSTDVPLGGDCSAVPEWERSHLVYLQGDLLPLVSGVRLLVPASTTLCVSGARRVAYSGFRPY